MRIKYDIKKLKSALYDFYNVTGFKISVLDTEFRTIAEAGSDPRSFCALVQSYDNCDGCRKSDAAILQCCKVSRKPEIRVCHAGLTNIALPILLKGVIIGYVILGQARESKNYEVVRGLLPVQADHALLSKRYSRLICYSRAQIESAARMAVVLTLSILAEDMIKLEAEELSERAAEYIAENLCSNLSVEKMCIVLGVSKNSLYKSFRTAFDRTVTEYVIELRIQTAKKLLRTDKLSVREVGEKVGIPEEAYFCRIFKRREGCTPLQYRKKSAVE